MIAFCASTLERQASRRWTTSWSEPWEAIANTAPPSREARKEFSPLSGLSANTKICVFPASAASPSQPMPVVPATTLIAMLPPATYSSIWTTSNQTTAVEPQLDQFQPDHGAEPTDQGVQDRDHRQDHGDGEVAQLHAQPVEDHLQRDRGGQHADPVGEQAGEQEGDPGGGLGAAPEAFAQVG